MTNKDKLQESIRRIRNELSERISYFKEHGLLLEAQRIEMRTKYDLEMLEEIGITSGIENYSTPFSIT